MYKISVPVTLSSVLRYGIENYIGKLKEMKAERVFISIDSYEVNPEKFENITADLKKTISVFKEAGFETGVWLWTFMIKGDKKYTHITSPNGAVSADQVCPSDEAFREFASEYIRKIALCAPDLILFDDDFRYGFLDCGLGCACKNHRKYMSELLGEDLEKAALGEEIFGGEKNKYRSAFLKANKHYFSLFAKQMRAAVNRVNPEIRLGVCACLDVWDYCGISADEISLLLAGDTKPFLRLIGAPYWSATRTWGNRLQDVIELERMECTWSKSGIEILSEGDSWPRPAYTCSAARLECFDLMLRAIGCTDGILKYVFDYYSSPRYETRYFEKSIENAGLYKKIALAFDGKTAVGVRVHEVKNKFENMDVPEPWNGKDDVQNGFFSYAARLLATHSIPSVYEDTCGQNYGGIAFGENAKYLSENDLQSGLILDVRAAEILEKRGIDTGLQNIGESVFVTEEYFAAEKEYTQIRNSIRKISVKQGAEAESYCFTEGQSPFRLCEGESGFIGSYRYENAHGQKFLVFSFEGCFASEHALKQYARGRQLRKAIEWFSGKKLPVSVDEHPDLYMICKADEHEISAMAGNFAEDAIKGASFTLDGEYRNAEFINCRGTLAGNTVTVKEIAPFTCAGFKVIK